MTFQFVDSTLRQMRKQFNDMLIIPPELCQSRGDNLDSPTSKSPTPKKSASYRSGTTHRSAFFSLTVFSLHVGKQRGDRDGPDRRKLSAIVNYDPSARAFPPPAGWMELRFALGNGPAAEFLRPDYPAGKPTAVARESRLWQ